MNVRKYYYRTTINSICNILSSTHSRISFTHQIWPFVPRDGKCLKFETAFNFAFNFNFQWNSIHITSRNRIYWSGKRMEKWKRNDFCVKWIMKKFSKSYFLFLVPSVFYSTMDQHIFNEPFSFACSHLYIRIFIPKKGTHQTWNTTIGYQICDESLLSYSIYYSLINW